MTNKEIADRLRGMVGRKYIDMPGLDQAVRSFADELDPPRPEPGTVVWWRYKTADDEEFWKLGEVHIDGWVYAFGSTAPRLWKEIEYKPARILGPDEVAVEVTPNEQRPLVTSEQSFSRQQTSNLPRTKLDRLIGIEELANRLSVAKSTIYSWCHHQTMPYYRLGRRSLFDPVEVLQLLEDRKVDPFGENYA